MTTLFGVPNVSEGRDRAAIAAIGEAFASTGARLLAGHDDPDHNRSVYWLAAGPGELAEALVAGAREIVARAPARTSLASDPGAPASVNTLR